MLKGISKNENDIIVLNALRIKIFFFFAILCNDYVVAKKYFTFCHWMQDEQIILKFLA